MTPVGGCGETVILGVAASDSHVVANHLIAHYLRGNGYTVVNLGPCTSVREFAGAFRDHPGALAVVIGSLNGHAAEDLVDLREAKDSGAIGCPVILGGNLSVGADRSRAAQDRFHPLGVDHVLSTPAELLTLLRHLQARIARAAALAYPPS